MTSRRRFLLYSGTAMLTTGVTLYTGAQPKVGSSTTSSTTVAQVSTPPAADLLHLNDFKSHTHETFHLHTEDGRRLKLRLSEVGNDPLDPQLEQFHLTFQGPRHDVVEQGVYTLEHSKLGKLDLLMVPDRLAERGPQYYNVSFSHFLA